MWPEYGLVALNGVPHEERFDRKGSGEVRLCVRALRPVAVHPCRDGALPQWASLPRPALHPDGHHRHCAAPQESNPPGAAPCVEGGAEGAEGGDLAG